MGKEKIHRHFGQCGRIERKGEPLEELKYPGERYFDVLRQFRKPGCFYIRDRLDLNEEITPADIRN
jgi:hypothetical protein